MALRRSWRVVRPYLPRPAIDAVVCGYREYMRLRCWYQGVRERSLLPSLDARPIPPPFLRYRVDGSTDLGHFLTVGQRIVADMDAALKTIGRDFASFRDILDFGCGCGRVLLWLRDRVKALHRLHGTDIDSGAIRWCRTHLGFGKFTTNQGRPPLGLPDDSFDFVYAISVFTHLDVHYQRAWLEELARVTRPGGVVLVTVHGPSCAGRLDSQHQRRLLADGFLFSEADSTRGFFPRWYQASYQTPQNVREVFGRSFEVLAQIPQGLSGYQDIVLLQKGRGESLCSFIEPKDSRVRLGGEAPPTRAT
jgi:SAM-dependent methyltransferase